MSPYRNPIPTVDIIIEMGEGVALSEPVVVLIERRNPPHGWAVPGGFVDYGESLEQAARREALEETSLDIVLTEQFHTYSAPERDPRKHTITTVFLARGRGEPVARDDAKAIGLFKEGGLPTPMAFDHSQILADFFKYRRGEGRPKV